MNIKTLWIGTISMSLTNLMVGGMIDAYLGTTTALTLTAFAVVYHLMMNGIITVVGGRER